MIETIVLASISLACIGCLATVCVVLAKTLKKRNENDTMLVKRMSDQLISNSDYQLKRLEIEAAVVDTKEKARIAAIYTNRMGQYSVDPNVNGFGGSGSEEVPDFTTKPME